MLVVLFLLYSCVSLLSTAAKKGKIVKKKAHGGQPGSLSPTSKSKKAVRVQGLPAGVTKAVGGARKGVKGAKKGAKVTRKGFRGGQKGLRAGIHGARETKRARDWTKTRELQETRSTDWSWKEREPTEIEENCEVAPIAACELPRVDMSFARPQLARRSRLFNERLRKDWRYLVDDEGNTNFLSARYGATFLMPVGWPPSDLFTGHVQASRG